VPFAIEYKGDPDQPMSHIPESELTAFQPFDILSHQFNAKPKKKKDSK
jgi:hypothetical protein